MDKGSLEVHSALIGVDARMPVGMSSHVKWEPSCSSFLRLFIAVALQVLCVNSTVLNW